jgi:pimeloyl-ACP methyl ester carboxylesterase
VRTIRACVLGMAALVAACSGATLAPSATAPAPSISTPSASPQPPSPAPTVSDTLTGRFTVNGRDMFLECKGIGSPTVIVEAGIGSGSGGWADGVGELAQTTRACRYDRAGLGFSDPHAGGGDLSAGDRADDLHALLQVAGVDGPYVLAGFSYGGMITRAFTDRFPSEVGGLVFIDATSEKAWAPGSWILEHDPLGTDGVHAIDVERTREELLAATDLGDRPTIVLTQGNINGEFERQWSPIQDALAEMSSKSLHMVATESGHDIRADRPELVIESIVAAVEAVRHPPLAQCGPRFETLGAECLETTMSDLLATWDARRAEVVPTAGQLPAGAYGFKHDGVTFKMTIDGGRLDVAMRHPDGLVESLTAEYSAIGDQVTFRWPFDWRIPRTSGVNVARWTLDPDGAIQFAQVDSEPSEGWISVPWVPCDRRVGAFPCLPD